MPGPIIRSAPPPPGTASTTGVREAFRPTPAAEVVPGPQDAFHAQEQPVGPELTGLDSVRDARSLGSDLSTARTAAGVVKRLGRELPVVLPELTGLSTLTREQKASRLVEFFAPYAARFAELSQPMDGAARAVLERQLLGPMLEAGLAHVVDLNSGRAGLELAQQLLQASPSERADLLGALRLDAPELGLRPDKEFAGMPPLATRLPEPQLVAQPKPASQPREGAAPGDAEEAHRQRRGSDRVLGRNLLWNTLHLFRKGPDAPTLQDEEHLRTALVALGIGVLAAVLIAIFVLIS